MTTLPSEVTTVNRVPSSLQRWLPASMLVAVLLGGTAAAQRIGIPWGNLMAGLLSLTGLLLSCIVAVTAINILLRLSSRCYREWTGRPAVRSSRPAPRRRYSLVAYLNRPSSLWMRIHELVRGIAAPPDDAIDDEALHTSPIERAPATPSAPPVDPIYDRFADKAA
jgi:hypothetical protein